MTFNTNTWIGNRSNHTPIQDEISVRRAYRLAASHAEKNGHVVSAAVDEDFIFSTSIVQEALDLGIDSGIRVKNEDDAIRIWWREYGCPTYGDCGESGYDADYVAHFAKFA